MATIQLSNDINTQNKRNHQKKGFNLNRQNTLTQWLSTWAESPPWGRFWGARGQNNTKGAKMLNH